LQLAGELNLPLDPKASQITRGITGEPDWNSFYLGTKMAEAEFKVFPARTEGFLQQMNIWLGETYAQAQQYAIPATVGMKYVFQPFGTYAATKKAS
jgi:hypothetical protein